MLKLTHIRGWGEGSSECPGEGDLGGEVATRHPVPSPPLMRANKKIMTLRFGFGINERGDSLDGIEIIK